MGYAEELKKRAEEVREKIYQETYEQIKMMMATAVEQGKRSTSVSYKFFKGDNALLKYIIEKCMEDEFVLRLYEERMEVRLEE
jgi:hypothetical protein